MTWWVSFVTVITIALIHPSHWAIIIGTLVSAVILAVGSYRVYSYRPSWSLFHLRKQWQFSQWLLARGIVGFTRSQIDNLMVSKIFGATQLGGYNLVREVSLLPALSAIIPMSEPLLAAIAEGKTSVDVLAYRVRLSLFTLISDSIIAQGRVKMRFGSTWCLPWLSWPFSFSGALQVSMIWPDCGAGWPSPQPLPFWFY